MLGKVPTISIDKTDGCQMYLSPESLNVEIITSKSSEMNVLVPKGNGDYVSTGLNLSFLCFCRGNGWQSGLHLITSTGLGTETLTQPAPLPD